MLSEVWYPGWRARVDGHAVPVLRADYTLRAVELSEPGEHIIELDYRPASLVIGAAVTEASLLVLAVWAAVLRRSRR